MIRIIKTTLWLLVAAVALTACEKDPLEASDETLNKLHEDPIRVVISLTEGTYADSVFTPSATAQKQVITYQLNAEHGWAPIAAGDTALVVTASTDARQRAYWLTLKYYNEAGEDMTYQFAENGQDRIHQHFFIPRNIKSMADGTTVKLTAPNALAYYYMDTMPWDREAGQPNVTITGAVNPLGFKGVAYFPTGGIHYRLSIELMHALQSKYNSKGELSPYYRPTSGQRLVDMWDVKMTVPVYVNQQ